MSFGDWLDLQDLRLKRFHLKHARTYLRISVFAFFLNLALLGFFSVVCPAATPIFGCNTVLFVFSAGLNLHLSVNSKESNRTK